jgi:hypothetical protein
MVRLRWRLENRILELGSLVSLLLSAHAEQYRRIQGEEVHGLTSSLIIVLTVADPKPYKPRYAFSVTIGENCAKQSRTYADLAEKLKMPVEDLMRQANGHASASKALVKCLAKQLGIDETYLERLAAEVRKDLDSCHGAQRLFWLCQLLLCICTSILGYLFFWTAVLFRLVGQFFGYLLFCCERYANRILSALS